MMSDLYAEMNRIEDLAFNNKDVYERAHEYARIMGTYKALLMIYVNQEDHQKIIDTVQKFYPVKE